jgi:hypothetical protein
MGDEEGPLRIGETFDIPDREPQADVTLVVGFPVLHEVTNFLDVYPGARNLPQSSVRRLTTCTWLTFVALHAISINGNEEDK